MSFILDALKKLDREKETRDPDVVMVGPVPWGGRDRGHLGRKVALSAAVVAVLVAGALWWAGSGSPSSSDTAHRVPSSTPAPSPHPITTPSPAEADPSSVAAASARPLDPPPPRTLSLPGAEEGLVAPTDDVAGDTPTAAPSQEGQPATTAAVEAPAPVVAEPEPATGEDDTHELRLTAISSRDGEPVALLNDRLVREGDSFDGVRVLRIGTAEVEIEVDGERRTIGF